MVLPRQIRQRIESGDFEAVELAWLDSLDQSPEDLEHFAEVARSLVGAGQGDLARTLLDLLDEQLGALGLSRRRLELLRLAGTIMAAKGRLQERVLEILGVLYADRSSFAGLVENLGIERGFKDPAQLWDRVARLESLLHYTEDTVVWVEGHGPGHVAEVNYELEGFRIELESARPDMRVGFRAAPKILEALPDEHFLVRKRRAPDSLAQLSPAEILEQVMTSFERELTAAEIRDAIQGLIEPERWNSWWTSAKKHPQLIPSRKTRNAYQWTASTAEASDALWQSYERSDPRGRLELFRKNSAGDADLAERMAADLEEIAGRRRESDPALAFEIAGTLERTGRQQDPDTAAIVASPVWDRLIAGLGTRTARERAYEIAIEIREDWAERFAEGILTEADPALAGVLARALREGAPEAWERVLRRALAQPAQAPALFTWIAQTAGEDETLFEGGALRLFKKILQAAGADAFAPYRRQLVDLGESGGTLPRLLAHFEPGEASEALEALQRASAYSDVQRRALQEALTLRFPAFRETEEPLYALPASIEAKRAELKTLLEEEIPANRRAIEEARALGDLRENFEYKSARQRHEYLSARAEKLSHELARSQALDLGGVDCSEVRVGTRVVLEQGDGERRTVILLGPWESSPEKGILSYLSEVARALIGSKVGDEVELAEGSVRVVSIEAADALDD